MSDALQIPAKGDLDFLALGALVHRLDSGVYPFHKAPSCAIHVSGGEFNTAANLADCFGMRTGVASAMVDYPVGDLIAERVRAMGVRPFYKRFKHDGARGPNMAAVYSDRGYGVRAPVVFYNRSNEAAALLKPGDFDWKAIFAAGVRWFHSGGIFAALSETTAELIIEAMQAAKNSGAVVSFDLNYREKLWNASGGHNRALEVHVADREICRCAGRERGGSAEGAGHTRTRSCGKVGAGLRRLSRYDRPRRFPSSADQGPRHHAARGPLDEPPHLERGGVDGGKAYVAPTCELDVHDRVGGGDGFASGLFYGLMSGETPEEALKLGWAHGALRHDVPGRYDDGESGAGARVRKGGRRAFNVSRYVGCSRSVRLSRTD